MTEPDVTLLRTVSAATETVSGHLKNAIYERLGAVRPTSLVLPKFHMSELFYACMPSRGDFYRYGIGCDLEQGFV